MFSKAEEVIKEFRGQEHVRGQRDCNLMILKVFDEENYHKMLGTYSTIKGGVKASLRVYGVRSLREYLEAEGFSLIPQGFERPLDVVVFKNQHNVYLNLGTSWFGVTDHEVFGLVSPKNYQREDYLVFRKGE
ncbi:hypothetical protein [Vibrio parahaemolyticus]|uniref:hypothetical protein n=1 Tax=Vibrio parahaemolyticus TaxID=670 RepID=UPI000938F5DC|nr:hypothetical protein [Vibrio parahaemolyticus]MBE3704390.1 hypothetical protein [Vibrio parahaemolyticus]MBE3769357.1 hypothetical protein [Vibrio parahaemolyticus]MBE4295212.1 hypothetical protein [Vibrio parahaemolyticus]TOB23769.1 hypothetical protein CGK09_18900 [Vibrio parahaemolyticus]TXM33688.1 hypothetical protein FVP00_15925 [Vibrio parahaemolyticus]